MRAHVLLGTVLAALTFGASAPLAAQQRPDSVTAATDTTLTPEQRALQRLRAMGAVAAPDTAYTPGDTLDPQTVNVQGRGAAPRTAMPSAIPRDSIMEALLRLSGYIGTEFSGDRALFAADSNRLELRGSPQVAREGMQLVADSLIVYDERIGEACGYGQPVVQSPEMANPLVSDTVCYNVRLNVARAKGATTRVEQGAQWNVRCDAYYVGDALFCHDAIFTDCNEPPGHEHYTFGAGRLKVLRGNVMVARDVTMRFADVPVFWLPFMVQSLSRGRRSGVLMPRFGVNDIARTSSRYSRRIEDVGVYWAINDYMGAELAMDWFANNWTAVRSSFDYNWEERFLRGGLTARHYWRDEGGTDLTLASQNSWQPDERTNINVSAQYASSSEFVRRRTFDPRELNRSIDSNASVRRRFDWGTTTVGASRRQQLSDNTVTSTFPSLDLSISPIALFGEPLPGEESWYSSASWRGDMNFRMEGVAVGDESTSLSAQSRRALTSRVNSSFNVGNFSLSQNVDFNENTRDARIVTAPDSTVRELAAAEEQRGGWRSTLSYQQNLIGSTTFTPGITLGGNFIRNEKTGDVLLNAPTRVDFSANLRTDVFGIWGLPVGPFSAMRHRLSPSIGYNYSPDAEADSLQRVVFTTEGVLEQNRISFGLSQTFEAKYRERGGDQVGAAPGDSAAARDTALATAATVQDTTGADGLRRRAQSTTIMLLSLNTNMFTYDFVRERESGQGLVTTQMENNIQSDLLRGMTVSFTHDLFRPTEGATPGPDGAAEDRELSLHLSRVSANFQLSGDSWLFRILRLGRASDSLPSTSESAVPMQPGDPVQGGPAVDRTESEFGLIGTSRRTGQGRPTGAAGTWQATFNYTMFRPREGQDRDTDRNQMVTTNLSFQPTENWGVTWNTGYSITTGDFTDHVLTLTRTLHDWDANFDFVKAQNGNFSFQFRVHLRANPDIKLDYSQADVQGLRN